MRLSHPERRLPGTLLLFVLAFVACGDEPPPPVTPDQVAENLIPAVRLEGEDPMTFTVAERMERYNVPGVSVAVMQGGEIVWARGWGTADGETGRPVGPTTLFQAASISKPVAALTVMTLVEDGSVALDSPVNDFMTGWRVPENEFTADSAVTLRGILSHTAGLTVWGFPGYRKDQAFGDEAVASNVQVLDGLGNTPAVRVYKVPGISWQYSGGGYTVMEQMVEDVTGRPFAAVAAERVLRPAGMTLSTYEQPLPEDRWGEAARGHRGDGSEVEGEWHDYPEQAAAGLWTTPTELMTLAGHLNRILHDPEFRGILDEGTLGTMLTAHRGDEEGFQGYGLGFSVEPEGDEVRIGHGGSNEGFKAQWSWYRQSGDGAAVMTNGDRGSALAAEILRGISDLYDWPGYRPQVRAARFPSADELAPFVGRYTVEGTDLTLTVSAGDGVLVGEVPGQTPFTLHADAAEADTFFDLDDGQEVVFERDEDGEVVALVAGGQTRLVRVEDAEARR